jgi:trans-2,3-dihydro-3-hydroxyanthranilate isomerase
MSQPVPTVGPFDDQADLLAALGVERSELPIELYDNGLQHVYVCLRSPEDVAALKPDYKRLAERGGLVCVSTIAGSGTTWKTRMFAPGGGVDEDPATGSAAGPLCVHLVRHRVVSPAREIEITQGVEIDRPSKLYARVDGTPDEIDRVEVGGSAVVVARGEFSL